MTEILICSPMPPAILARLETRFTAHRLWEAPDRAALLAKVAPRIRGMATSALAGFIGAELITALPALEIIANFGVGYDNIDVAAAKAAGVMVTNSPGVLTEETADLTLGLLLATLRQIPQAERHLREGKWLQGLPALALAARAPVGILGLGEIGKAVARRLEGFGVGIAYCGRHRQEGVPYAYHPTRWRWRRRWIRWWCSPPAGRARGIWWMARCWRRWEQKGC
jgi:lactate dehydrogenase-like 2-hydroxyacid dehydrogenase